MAKASLPIILLPKDGNSKQGVLGHFLIYTLIFRNYQEMIDL